MAYRYWFHILEIHERLIVSINFCVLCSVYIVPTFVIVVFIMLRVVGVLWYILFFLYFSNSVIWYYSKYICYGDSSFIRSEKLWWPIYKKKTLDIILLVDILHSVPKNMCDCNVCFLHLQRERGDLSSCITVFNRFTAKLRQRDCCPLCHRDFPSKDEVNQLIEEVCLWLGTALYYNSFLKLAYCSWFDLVWRIMHRPSICFVYTMFSFNNLLTSNIFN